MQGPALCALGIAVLAASLAMGDGGSDRPEKLALTLAAAAGALVAAGFFYIIV
jgi:hypothetical protein